MTTTTQKTTYKVEQMMNSTMTFMGEAPYYDAETTSMYWTDVIGGQMFRKWNDKSEWICLNRIPKS